LESDNFTRAQADRHRPWWLGEEAYR
jgi:hypothetical protein